MVIKLGSSSECFVHMWSDSGNLICSRNLLFLNMQQLIFSEDRPVFLHMCTTRSELPYISSIMVICKEHSQRKKNQDID